jgi:Fibronectin type III domain
MRRALLLGVALLAPAFGARAQTVSPGQIQFGPDNVVGKNGCGPSSTEQITLLVNPTLQTGQSVTGGNTFRVLASQTPPTTTTSNGVSLPICASDAGQAGNDITSTGSTPQPITLNTNDLLSAAKVDCASTSNVTVYVCALYIVGSATVTNPTGSATANLIYSVVKPGTPVITSVEPAQSALVVSWNAASDASYYIVSADAVNTADDPTHHQTGHVTRTSETITGLLNGTLYNVTVVAYSAADVASDPSAPFPGTPTLVDDFWERYQNAQGREQGGCASGPGGLLGIVLAAAAAGLSRLRRRS